MTLTPFSPGIAEIKSSGGALKADQTRALAALAVQEGKPLEFIFFRAPTEKQYEKLLRWVGEGAEGADISLSVSYLLK